MNGFWQAIRNGETPANELLIDAHGHLGPYAELDIAKEDRCWEDDMLRYMDQCGVATTICSLHSALNGEVPYGNNEMARIVSKYPGRIAGYTTINPQYGEDETLAELERHLLKGNHKGIKIHPESSDCPVTSPLYRPIWDFAHKHQTPMLSHTWHGSPTCAPAMFVQIAKAFPHMPIIVGHSGGSPEGVMASIDVAKQADNIYLDLCTSGMPHGIIEHMVKSIGADRVLFGTDVCFYDGRAKIGQLAGARISDADKRKIFGENARHLFRLPVHPENLIRG